MCGLGGAFAVASWGIGVSDPTRMAASKPGFTYSENDKITGDYYSPRYPNELINKGSSDCIHMINGKKGGDCCKNCSRRAVSTYDCRR